MARLVATTTALFTLALLGACSSGTSGGRAESPSAGISPSVSTTEAAGGSVASGCPEGKWTLSNAELAEFWNVIQAESGPGADFTVAGSVVLDLNADKSLAWTFQDYSVTLSVAGVASVTQIEGAITGQWSSDDKTLTATNLLDDTSATLTVNGVEQPGAAAIGEQIIANFPIENVTYSCEGSDLIVDSPTVDGTKKLTLTPA